MRSQATALDITVTISPGLVLAPPAPYSIRLGLRQTAGTVSLAGFVTAFSFFLAGQPWQAGCSGIATVPYLISGLLLAVSADLLLLPRTRNRRLRQSAIMNGLLLGLGLTLLLSVMLKPVLEWPVLFPVLFVAFAIPSAGPLNTGVVSRLNLSPHTWRVLTCACLGSAILLMVGGFLPFQDHVACQWTRP